MGWVAAVEQAEETSRRLGGRLILRQRCEAGLLQHRRVQLDLAAGGWERRFLAVVGQVWLARLHRHTALLAQLGDAQADRAKPRVQILLGGLPGEVLLKP